MAFKGLFIGVDRYDSPNVGDLTCARRDATALHALFVDNLAGDNILLVDEAATKVAVAAAFQQLTGAQPDDVVVIAFSGHGTETHELLAHDSEIFRRADTAISLKQLDEWCAAIPVRRLLVVLDCCFSGGMGAKAIQVDDTSRDAESVESKLQHISGNGRVVLTASGPAQRAWESRRHGHGYLTAHLISALQGPQEIRSGNQISVLSMLNYVVRKVEDSARQTRRDQNPTIRGTFDGGFSWPVFTLGAAYKAAFPELQRPIATAEISSLQAFGFPEPILSAWASEIPSLNALQVEAINDYGVLRGEHLVASAPTSSGKTMLGELAAIKGALERRRALFLLPQKALVSDKRRYFERVYGPYGIRTIEATGETDDISPLLRGKYDIALLTYEKFAAIVLTHPYILEQVGTVVVDEVQMIADESRGANLEFILTLLRMKRADGVEPQVVALSAVIGDTNGLEGWLGAKLLRREQRPVPLDEGVICHDGRFRYIDGDTKEEKTDARHIVPLRGEGKHRDWVIPTAQRLMEEGKQVIVFRETTGETQHGAQYLAEALGLPPASDALAALPTGDPSQASGYLRKAMTGGVAFHNSHLDREERRVIEEEFRKPGTTLRVIVATTTLAMGVNTPASAVIIVGLEHPSADGPKPYSVAEYKNLVGRAGRLGFSERGASYLVATDGREEHDYWNRYIKANPENLGSRFLDADPRTLIIRVVVAASRATEDGIAGNDIIIFLESSFGAFQRSQSSRGWSWNRGEFQNALQDLSQNGFLQQSPQGRLKLTPLGRMAGESTIEMQSLIRMVGAVRAASVDELTDPALLAVAAMSVELDEVYFPINRRSTEKEPQHWKNELHRQDVSRGILNALRNGTQSEVEVTLRAKKAVTCLYYISGTPLEEIERSITQFGGAFGGAAGPIRGITARACDVLPTVGRIAELIHVGSTFQARITRLLTRLDLGVQGPVVELARSAGRALERSDYRHLCETGLTDPAIISKESDDTLLPLLNNSANKLAILKAAAADVTSRQQTTPPVALPKYVA